MIYFNKSFDINKHILKIILFKKKQVILRDKLFFDIIYSNFFNCLINNFKLN